MGCVYSAAFDLSALRDGLTATDYALSITLTRAAHTDVVITPADFAITLQCHDFGLGASVNHEAVAVLAEYEPTSFANALQNAIATEMTAQSWAGSITVSFSTTTARYTIATSGFSCAMDFGNVATRYLLGYTANQTSNTSHVGTATPFYRITATHDGRHLDREDDFEPEEIADLAIGDDAVAFKGVSRTTAPKFRTWTQQFNRMAIVAKARYTADERFTFEHLFEHCRCEFPFIVDDADTRMSCVLLKQGSSWRGKQRTSPGGDVFMHVPFNVWHVGAPNEPG